MVININDYRKTKCENGKARLKHMNPIFTNFYHLWCLRGVLASHSSHFFTTSKINTKIFTSTIIFSLFFLFHTQEPQFSVFKKTGTPPSRAQREEYFREVLGFTWVVPVLEMLVYIPSALNENFIKGDLMSMALAVAVCVKKYHLIFISAYQVVPKMAPFLVGHNFKIA